MIGITGATGQLGRLIVKKLLAKVPASEIVAIVRDPAKAADLGVVVRKAEYDNPETLDAAFAGIDTLLLISSNEFGKRAAQHANVVAAAKRAGVKLIGYTSILHADTSEIGLAVDHRQTEADIRASGLPFVFLRNGWYTENYAGSIPGAVAGGALIGSAGEGKISAASRADYADAAVVALTSEGQAGKVYELAGDTAFTLADLAAEISKQTGKVIPYNNLSEADYAAALASFGLPEGLAATIASWDVPISKGALHDESHTLSKLIGHPTSPISEVVTQALKG
ncbi:SDR family oxidoreductase [Kaistia dalseonensis]|uniref:NAD(P)H dehydrogenase (Quinone) n=1 Tax=Kaistia dalseonensis TaxID=410840 RepID=A0ABU0H773_9HYPH|nr:SDR family oxidoreductase [Kaistia dalseonensis]MCX5495564.1 SDR family oxidoreductase [Kaistia dalseonensis]MDQ0438156.1 NAD(P)H dehydrogenase (quinone) [Kaistia dalseonensis]